MKTMKSITDYKTPNDDELLSSLEYRISVHEANLKAIIKIPSIHFRTQPYARFCKSPDALIVKNETWKNLTFYNRNLSWSEFSNSKISCDFDNCDMSNSEFSNCDFGNDAYVTEFYDTLSQTSVFENCTFNKMYFTNVDLSNALFKKCKFTNCIFERSNLFSATFENCTFEDFEMRCVNLINSTITNCAFNNGELLGVNFADALIINSSTDNVKTDNYTANWHIACPQEGAFIAWKRVVDGKFVKLQICEDARRSSSTSRKCRCDKALVLGIYDENKTLLSNVKKICSIHDNNFVYEVNKIACVDNFDENRWNECAPGIHFFMTFEEAKNYRD